MKKEILADLHYTIDIEESDLIDIYVNKWVLRWCKQYHPDAFKEATNFIKGLLNENK